MEQKERLALLRFGSFELDLGTGELSNNGRRVRLQDQPSKLLVLLAGRAGRLVTREEIQQALWGEGKFVEFDHAINTAVKKIRAALEDDVEQPRLIETLPRKGYRFIGSVESISVGGPPVTAPSEGSTWSEEPDESTAAVPGVTGGLRSTAPGDQPTLLSPRIARALFLFIQAGYLALYCSALYYLGVLEEAVAAFGLAMPDQILILVIITAMCGIAVRLYLASSVGLAHPSAGLQFHRLFPAVLFLDSLWAASPLLAGRSIGLGLALAAAAGLAYLPFSQRTLIRNIYAIG